MPSSRPPSALLATALAAMVVVGCAAGGASPSEPPAWATAPAVTATGPSPADQAPQPPTPSPTDPAAPTGGPPTAAACDDPLGCWGAPTVAATIPVELLPEVSGLAASRTTPGAWWVADDGAISTVHLVTAEGIVGTVTLDGFTAVDAEDLAAGPCGPDDPASCLYVGDTGDNVAARTSVRVARFPEPPAGDHVVTPEVITLTYPDGPVDAEALLVDRDGTPLIVTKQRDTAAVLAAPGFADGVAVHVADLPIPEPELPLRTMFVGLTVTAADAVEGRVLIRTYDHAVEYVAPDPATAALAEFPTWPHHEVPTASEPQGEAIAWLPDGSGYATASESAPAVRLVTR